MRYRTCCVAALVLASLLGGATAAAAQDVVRLGAASIVQTAPFYLYADESTGPLEALKPGTAVTVLEIEGDWALVEYKDARHGPRQGYVKVRFVKPDAPAAPPPTAVPAAPPAPSAPAAAARTAAPGAPSDAAKTPASGKPQAVKAPAHARPPAAAAPQPPRARAAKPAKRPWRGWSDRAFLAVSGAYQSGASSFSESHSFSEYLENATIRTDYPAKDGPGFDAAAGVRLWKGLALGAGVTRTDRTTTGSISGTVPHPFHFDTPRPVSGTVSIGRTETAINAQAAWVVPAGKRFLVTLSGGPAFFTVSQSLVESTPFTESYPYDSAELSSPVVTRVSKSALGINAGIDLGFYFTRAVGLGAGVRYARARMELPLHGGSIGTDAGGVQAVLGLRLRVPPAAPKKPGTKAPKKK